MRLVNTILCLFSLTAFLVSIGLNIWCLRHKHTTDNSTISQYDQRSQIARLFLAAGCVMSLLGMGLGVVA